MYQPDKAKFSNIAISGIAGTGSTTLLKQLKERLKKHGWQGYSGGEYMRQFMETPSDARHHHDVTQYPEKVDRDVDMDIRHKFEHEQGYIIESWLAGFLAQGLPHVLKVLVICSNDLQRANRLAKRDHMTPEVALLHSFQRLNTNVERWARMYTREWQEWVILPGRLMPHSDVYYWYPDLYDLVIDTAVNDETRATMRVLQELGFPRTQEMEQLIFNA